MIIKVIVCIGLLGVGWGGWEEEMCSNMYLLGLWERKLFVCMYVWIYIYIYIQYDYDTVLKYATIFHISLKYKYRLVNF